MQEEIKIELGDYFGGPLEKKCKAKFVDIAKQLDPTYIIDERALIYKSEPRSIAGKYFMIKGYGFRECSWGYECLITPTDNYDRIWKENLEPIKPMGIKAEGDRSKSFFTRYKTVKGGKEEFNPTTKAGGWEDVQETKNRIR